MRIVFMGTPKFAAAALEAIIAHGDEVVLVVTRADKPKGRGYVFTPSDVKEYAVSQGIPVITPQTLRDPDTVKTLKDAEADLFVVAAYGRILTQEVLDLPKIGCINIHASLLPSLRGAAPIERAIMRGDTEGGVTIMFMDAGIDTGDIILQKRMSIPHDMNGGEHREKLSALGAQAICEFLDIAPTGAIPRQKQPTGEADYAAKIEKNETHIDFSLPSSEVYNKIRGLSPVPCGYTTVAGKRLKVCACRESDGNDEFGLIIGLHKDGFEVACGSGSVVLTEVQPEGKGRMKTPDFMRGTIISIGDVAE